MTEKKFSSPIYLDCNATTPLDPGVRDVLLHFLTEEYGNEGSRTHEYGSRAKQAVQKARDQVGALVKAKRDEVVFTSGATESNNLAVLGLAEAAAKAGKKHLITSRIEHKAVLEPFEYLEGKGFEVTYLPATESGRVDPGELEDALRPDTWLVSLMHVNNETGIVQPMKEYCEVLGESEAYLHTDAAQGYGKEVESLQNPRIDLISISGHKIFAPKGIGALITRRRGYKRPPLKPLAVGGGQERGLRPGTLPVAMIAALGTAAELALKEAGKRQQRCLQIREKILQALEPLNPAFSGDQEHCLPHVLNFSVGDIDSEALMVSTKDLVAISNGSACTSTSYSASHVLKAMGMDDDQANACVRISWCHLTPEFEWTEFAERIRSVL